MRLYVVTNAGGECEQACHAECDQHLHGNDAYNIATHKYINIRGSVPTESVKRLKKEQLQKAMLQIGIVDQLIEIAKIRFPKKYSSDEAWDFNIIMKRRMKARRINYAFENVNATLDRVDIIE